MTITRRTALGAFGVLAATLVFVALLLSRQGGGPADLQNATLLPQPKVLADFSLIDDRGMPLTRTSLQDRWTLLFFGFTHCPDICPITLQQLAAARRELQKSQSTPLPDILLVSVDPQRDTQAALAAYVASFGDGVRGARGDIPALQQLTADLGIFFQREPGDDDSYQVSHSAAVLLINPRGELHAILSAPQQVPALVNDLPLLMKTS